MSGILYTAMRIHNGAPQFYTHAPGAGGWTSDEAEAAWDSFRSIDAIVNVFAAAHPEGEYFTIAMRAR